MKNKILWIFGGGLMLLGLLAVFFILAAFWMLQGKDFSEGLKAKGDLAVVEIRGPIMSSKEWVEQLDKVEKNPHIKGLLLRIDSTGGSVGYSQEVYEAVVRIREKKKVIVSMGAVAASGAYYVAAPAHKIVANPGTVTGSIGVRLSYTNIEELLKFLKLHAEVLKAGKNKDVGSPIRPFTMEDRTLLNGILKNMHQQFKAAVQKWRGLSQKKVDEIADGRVLTGEQALKAGLVDQLGNQQSAMDLAKSILGVDGELELVKPKKSDEIFLILCWEKT